MITIIHKYTIILYLLDAYNTLKDLTELNNNFYNNYTL